MPDNLPTIWSADPHTLAKHKILSRYLDAWIPILSRTNPGGHALFVDAFAGPGEYSGGQPGSPLIALRTTRAAVEKLNTTFHFRFAEADIERCEALGSVLEREKESLSHPRIKFSPPVCQDAATMISEFLDGVRGPKLPSIFFLDQFGYKDVPMSLLARLLSFQQCEVLTYLEVRKLSNFFTDKTKWKTFDAAFGDDSWRAALTLEDGRKREVKIAAIYADALSRNAGAKFTWRFAMKGANNQIIYWLFFCTGNIRGLEEMKKAMLKVDDSGQFMFSDFQGGDQLSMASHFNGAWLSQDLILRFAGSDVTVQEVKEYVLTGTPCVLFKKSLGMLEREGRVQRLSGIPARRKGDFPDAQERLRFK